MLGDTDVLEIQIMYKQGCSLKQISREMGYSINTVRKYIRDAHRPKYKLRDSKPSKLEDYKAYLHQRMEAAHPHWIPASVLFSELRGRGYKGGISLLRHYLYPLKPKSQQRPLIRFETEPGEQMQVDFAHFKHNGCVFYAFVAVLGYSRMAFVRFVENQQIETVIRCHEEAFDYFGGVPKKGLYDNMKTIIIKRDAYGEGRHKLHSNFYDFAKHYGFHPRVCKPYSPQTKGKVERTISYLRYSFYHPFSAGKKELSLDELNIGVMDWLNHSANQRIHATTNTPPIERWVIEKPYLLKIPPNYTTNYGDKGLSITRNHTLIMDQNTAPLQHHLSLYDALLHVGDRS
jgi:transposase